MKNLFKQTGIALSIALLSANFAFAQDVKSVITPSSTLQSEDKTVDSVEREAIKNVEQKKAKPVKIVKKKNTTNEINMVSKGDFRDFSMTNEDTLDVDVNIAEIHNKGVIGKAHIVIPDIDNEELRKHPLDYYAGFTFTDKQHNPLLPGALISIDGKDVKVYEFSTDLTKYKTKTLQSQTEEFSSKVKFHECKAIYFEYSLVGASAPVRQSIFINKYGRVSDKLHRSCKQDQTDPKQTAQYNEDTGYFQNLTWNKVSSMEGKNQSFLFQTIKAGKNVPIYDAKAYIFTPDLKSFHILKADFQGSNEIQFNDLKLNAGTYKILLEYTVDGKQQSFVSVRKITK